MPLPETQISQNNIRTVIIINLKNISKKVHYFMRCLFIILH